MSDFKPYLWIVAERKRVQPMFAAAVLEDHVKRIELPKNVSKLPPNLEVKLIGGIGRRFFEQNHGKVLCFPIKYFVYVRTEHERWAFTAQGRFIGQGSCSHCKHDYTLHLKGKPNADIGFLFRRRKRH
jgi:hypothetical protein